MESNVPPPSPAPMDELRRTALSDDPAVRAEVADRVRARMEAEFETVFDATQEWALDSDARLREVAALACRQESEATDEVRARRLIGRLELFLGDRDRHVADLTTQDVLPFLLGRHPAIVPEWIHRWAPNTDETIRADLARVLGMLALRFPAESVEGLAELSVDPRPRVREAVVAMLHELGNRNPKMRPYLTERFGALLRTS